VGMVYAAPDARAASWRWAGVVRGRPEYHHDAYTRGEGIRNRRSQSPA
jgi:hypothetical protein